MAEVNGDAVPQANGHHTSSSPSSQPVANGATTATVAIPNPSVPLTSIKEDGTSKRPRDARLIHLLLSSLGVTAYQERVPLQLLDFAYRHTSSILSDALHLSSDAYISQQTRARDAPPTGAFKDADGSIQMSSVQLAISSRLQYQFNGGMGGGVSKEVLLERAEARNKIALPRMAQNEWGNRLPSEKFVLTGTPWGLKDEWETETVVDEEDEDVVMGMDGATEEAVEGEEEGGTAADIFGDDLEDENMDMEDS